VKLFFIAVAVVLTAACSGPPQTLVVKQFQVRDQLRKDGDDPMVRMEKERHLLGAVSMEERRQRLGQYYTIRWSDSAGVGKGDVRLVFMYQQGVTGSLVKRMTRDFSSSTAEGMAEFAVIGDDYFTGGKVLTWKATVTRGGRELASRQSYLWQ
jgi:hypothetical protein